VAAACGRNAYLGTITDMFKQLRIKEFNLTMITARET
jgi:hypothetical protein